MSTIRNPNGSSSEIGPDWQTFAWAVFIFHYAGFDYSYQQLLTNESNFFHILRTQPNKANTSDIQEKLIKGFLNAWKCRMKNDEDSARVVKNALQELLPYFAALQDYRIETINFEQVVNVGNKQLRVKEAIEHIYQRIRKKSVEERIRLGATGISKLLHILLPALFVMWDKKIRDNYKNEDSSISNNHKGYRIYLETVQRYAMRMQQNFENANLKPPAKHGEYPVQYLSRQMKIQPAKTLAKYLDECNWLTSRSIKLPPNWCPGK